MSSQYSAQPDADGSAASKSWFAQRFPTFARIKNIPKKLAEYRTGKASRFARVIGFIFKWRPRLFFGGIAAFCVAYVAFDIYASVLWNRELAKIRAKGEPLTLKEAVQHSVPDSENAALVYEQAYKALQGTKKARIPKTFILDDPKLAPDFRQLLQKNQKAIALVRKASALPECVFLRDWNKSPFQITFPYFSQQRDLARLLAAQSVLEARSGQKEVALSDVRCIYRMADHLKNEPNLIGFLVARAINDLATNSLARILENNPISVQEGRAFLHSLPSTDWSASFRHVYVSERTFSIWLFSNISFSPGNLGEFGAIEGTSLPWWLNAPTAWLWRPFAKMDGVYCLRYWQKLIDSVSPMVVPMPSQTNNFENEFIRDAPSYAIVSKILFPVITSVRQTRDSIEVKTRLLENALALSAYRQRYGAYPNTLSDAQKVWGKALPADIYGDKRFRYQKQGNTFRLYSVGPNDEDDSGKGSANRSEIYSDDISWGVRSKSE